MNTFSIDTAAFHTAASVLRTASGAATAERSGATTAERPDAAVVENARERGLLTLLLMADLLAA